MKYNIVMGDRILEVFYPSHPKIKMEKWSGES